MAIGEDDNELNFDEEAGEIEETKDRMEFPVVGVVLMDRKISFQAFKELLASIWRPEKGISIKEIGDQRYMFTFYHIVDMNRVFEDGPWLFERDLLRLKAVQPDDIPEKMILCETDFCVQVHNAPFKFRNLGSARRIENYIGTFISFDKN
ncbi:unnamed protein product [Cuscuta epithymum]|uniref:DUF4283 domain-containing protein n=1 Tax=Cuscuta epithymum TaxID=186058 RepID=A0AAV0CEZ4_9ASTE|nr:unnamed protein product [Cuscuta epithymum]